MKPLPPSFFRRENVLEIAETLLGKALFTCLDGNTLTGGIITETEAYMGAQDKASHAYNNRRTQRTETLFQEGGVAYVYMCYGIHHLLNVVTNVKDTPHAVLIRALFPTHGLCIISKRRGKKETDKTLTSGPGALCQALGVTKMHNGYSLSHSPLWIDETPFTISPAMIKKGPRIGIDYAQEHALLPWRFYLPELPNSLRIDIDAWINLALRPLS